MSLFGIFNKTRCFLAGKQILHESRAYLNARRKAERTRRCLEPKRRTSVYFENPNSHPSLLNGPDYSYQDHRPVPYATNQYKRVCQNIEYTDKIIQLNKEIDIALQMEIDRKEADQRAIREVLERKLKPKGGTIVQKKVR